MTFGANASGVFVGAKVGATDFVVKSHQNFPDMSNTPAGLYGSTITHGNISDISATYNINIGYDFDRLRVDAEYGYGRYDMSGNWSLHGKNMVPDMFPPYLDYPATYKLQDRVSTLMLNATAEVFRFGRRYSRQMYGGEPHRGQLRAYNALVLTGGLGWAHIKETGGIVADFSAVWPGDNILRESADAKINRFAYSLGGGVSLGVTERASVDILYRYMGMGRYSAENVYRRYGAHSVLVGARYNF